MKSRNNDKEKRQYLSYSSYYDQSALEGLEPTAIKVAQPGSLEDNAWRIVLVVRRCVTKYRGVGTGLWVKFFNTCILISIIEWFFFSICLRHRVT